MKLTDDQRAERERATALIADSVRAYTGLSASAAYAMVADYLILWGVPAGDVHVANLASRGRQNKVRKKRNEVRHKGLPMA